jgi:hypothetical protein
LPSTTQFSRVSAVTVPSTAPAVEVASLPTKRQRSSRTFPVPNTFMAPPAKNARLFSNSVRRTMSAENWTWMAPPYSA